MGAVRNMDNSLDWITRRTRILRLMCNTILNQGNAHQGLKYTGIENETVRHDSVVSVCDSCTSRLNESKKRSLDASIVKSITEYQKRLPSIANKDTERDDAAWTLQYLNTFLRQ
jgi:hypothetical protein